MNQQRIFSLFFVCAALTAAPAVSEPWTLERAIDYALKSSPDAVIAQHRIAAANAGIEQAQAAFMPQLSVRSNYIRTDNPANVFMAALNQRSFSQSLDFNNVPDADNLNLKGMVTLPLYNGGRNVAGYDAAKAMEQSARYDAASIKSALAFQVAQTYYTVQKTREFVKAAEAAVASYQNNVTIAKRRMAEGTVLQAEVLDVDVRLAQANDELIRAKNANALTVRALRSLLGIAAGDFVVSSETPRLTEPEEPMPPERPEVASAKQMQEAARLKITQAAGGYLPRVSAFSSVDYNKGWEFNGDGTSYTAGAMAEWDVFDGFLTRGKVKEARALLNTADEQLRKLKIGIDFEQEQARLNLQEAKERVGVTNTAVRQAEESAKLTRVRFNQGLALSTQLIDSETALLGARVRNVEARADELIAIAAYRKALGLPILNSGQGGIK